MNDKQLTINISAGTIFKAIIVCLVFAFLYYIRDIVVIILTALVIASAIEPFIVGAVKHKIPRTLAVICIYLVLILGTGGVFYVFLPSIVSDISDFLTQVPNYINTISVWNPLAGGLGDAAPVVKTLGITDAFSLKDFLSGISAAVSTSEGFFRLVSGFFGGALSFILIVVLSFYLAVQEDGVGKFLKMVLPLRHEEYVVGLWHRSQAKIGKWLQGQLVLGVLIGILVYLGLSIFQVRNALLLALVAAIMEIIPAFGPIISAIPAVLIAISDGGLSKGFLVIGLYVIIHQFENHLIYPLVIKKIVGIPPIMVILALIVGFKLAGVLGLLLSVPAAAVLVELIDDIQRDKLAKLKAG